MECRRKYLQLLIGALGMFQKHLGSLRSAQVVLLAVEDQERPLHLRDVVLEVHQGFDSRHGPARSDPALVSERVLAHSVLHFLVAGHVIQLQLRNGQVGQDPRDQAGQEDPRGRGLGGVDLDQRTHEDDAREEAWAGHGALDGDHAAHGVPDEEAGQVGVASSDVVAVLEEVAHVVVDGVHVASHALGPPVANVVVSEGEEPRGGQAKSQVLVPLQMLPEAMADEHQASDSHVVIRSPVTTVNFLPFAVCEEFCLGPNSALYLGRRLFLLARCNFARHFNIC